jgi:PPE-repeat protein
MDFASLPPEVNSARMYVGPGAGPMLAAASVWDTVAAELYSTASSYQSVINLLTAGPWLGPASASMTAAAAPYVAWTRITATQAEQTANQARAAAAAYESAFAETVPPPVVAANRSMLMALVASNLFGQNTTAIAATEAQYAEMWAQDSGAMFGYASTSSAATTLTTFSSPSSNTNTAGQSGQAAAVAQADGVAAGDVQSAISSIQQALAAVPNALTGMASPAQGLADLAPLTILDFLSDLSGLLVDPELSASGLAADSVYGITALPFDVGGFYTGIHTDTIVSGWAGVQAWPGTEPAPPTSFPVITSLDSPVSAGVGEAASVGRLAVPSAWVTAAPELRLSAMALPATSVAAAAEASAGGAGSVFGQMALAGLAGRAMAGTVGAGGGAAPRTGERSATATRKPADPARPGPAEPPPIPAGGPITSIAAELRELASLRDAGILTEQEFTEQKQRLLPH